MTGTTTIPKRPSKISVTFLRPTTASCSCSDSAVSSSALLWDFLGLGICLNRCQGQILLQIVRKDGVLANKLLVGDILESINGCSCRNVEIIDVWDMLADDSTVATSPEVPLSESSKRLVTLTFCCPEGTSDLVIAITIPPSYTHGAHGDNAESESHQASEDSEKISCELGLSLEILECNRPLRRNRPKRLTIHEISSDGWLSGSVLQAGDSVLSINDQSTVGWSLDDVSGIFSAAKTGYTTISITATTVNRVNNPTNSKDIAASSNRPTWKQKVRRASVTVGGGVMVTTGAVLMVTPLHPVGHAMAIGGVAMLGGFRRKKDKVAQHDEITKESDSDIASGEISPEEVGSSSALCEGQVESLTASGEKHVTNSERQAA